MINIAGLLKYKDYVRYSSKVTLSTRYSNTYLGILWLFLDPLLLMMVYSFVYLVIFNVKTADYTVFILTGLVLWRWISATITQSASSISSKIGILEQVAVPKQIFPLVTLIVELFTFIAGFVLIIGALIIDNVMPTWHIVELLPLIAITFVWLYGIGLVVSHYGAFIADLKPAIAYGLRLVFYISPIFYDVSILPETIQKYYMLNPVAIIVQGFRNVIIYGNSPNYIGLLGILIMGLVLFWIGLHLIQKHDKDYGRLK